MSKELAEQLHNWYLESIKELNPGSYNENANKPFNKLSHDQQFIDTYIAIKLIEHYKLNKNINPYMVMDCAVNYIILNFQKELSDDQIGKMSNLLAILNAESKEELKELMN